MTHEPGHKTSQEDGHIIGLNPDNTKTVIVGNDAFQERMQKGLIGISNFSENTKPTSFLRRVIPSLRSKLSVYITPTLMSDLMYEKLEKSLSYWLSKEFGGCHGNYLNGLLV